MSIIRQWDWTYVWVKRGQPHSENRWRSFSDARHIADMELRRANRAMVEAGYQPVILWRDLARN